MKNQSKYALEKARYRARHPERAKAQSLRDRTKRGREFRLWSKAKARATVSGVPFEITVADIVIPAVCPALGIPLVSNGDFGNVATIDRIIPANGYVPSNIIVISHRANRIKADATLAELRAVLRYLENSLEKSGA